MVGIFFLSETSSKVPQCSDVKYAPAEEVVMTLERPSGELSLPRKRAGISSSVRYQ